MIFPRPAPENCASPLRVAHGSASRACAHRPKMDYDDLDWYSDYEDGMELRLDIVQKLAHDGREKVMMRVSVRARGIVNPFLFPPHSRLFRSSDTTPASARPQGRFWRKKDASLRKALFDMGFSYIKARESYWERPCSVRAAWRVVPAVRMEGEYGFTREDLDLATRRIQAWVDRDVDIEAHALGPSGINFDPPLALHRDCCAKDAKRVLFVSFMRQKDAKNQPWEPAIACVGRAVYDVKDTVLKPCGFCWDGEAWYLTRSGLDVCGYRTFADAAADIDRRVAGVNLAVDRYFVRLREAADQADALEARARAVQNNDAVENPPNQTPEGDDIEAIVERSAEEVEAEKLRDAQRLGNFFDMTAASQEPMALPPPSDPPPSGGAKKNARVKREPANDANAGVGGPQRTPPPVRSESRAPFARPRNEPRSRMSPPTPAPAATVSGEVRPPDGSPPGPRGWCPAHNLPYFPNEDSRLRKKGKQRVHCSKPGCRGFWVDKPGAEAGG